MSVCECGCLFMNVKLFLLGVFGDNVGSFDVDKMYGMSFEK